jgi:plastocyanin
MKKLITLSYFIFFLSTSAFCTTWVINNSGFTFSPANITISEGDDVNFILGSEHNAREVSQSTWNMNGNTKLPGGFETPFGGGLVPASQLPVGTHYYVCIPHASMGMKGIIVVESVNGTIHDQVNLDIYIYPNPFKDQAIIYSNENAVGTPYYIFDREGRQLSEGKLTSEPTVIDFSKLNPGLYLMQINGLRRQTIKLIKN